MKTIYRIILIMLISGTVQISAQVPNGDFETLNYDGSLSNWGNVYIFSVGIDSNGNTTGDSIVFDNYFYAPTTDAHTGTYALELRNAYNYTTNIGLTGSATVDTDSVYTAWGGFETIPTTLQPAGFNFYYKYFPVNGETASATLQVFDSVFNIIGQATILMSGTISNYTYATAPINYTSTAPVVAYYLNFNNCAIPAGNPGFGTRLLIDDVSIPIIVTGIEQKNPKPELIVYPNPAAEQLNFDYAYGIESVILKDLSGKELSLNTISVNRFNCSTVANGIYIATIKTKEGIYTRKVSINR